MIWKCGADCIARLQPNRFRIFNIVPMLGILSYSLMSDDQQHGNNQNQNHRGLGLSRWRLSVGNQNNHPNSFSFENVLFMESLALLLYVVNVSRSDDNVRIIQIFQNNFILIFIVEKHNKLLRWNIAANCTRNFKIRCHWKIRRVDTMIMLAISRR